MEERRKWAKLHPHRAAIFAVLAFSPLNVLVSYSFQEAWKVAFGVTMLVSSCAVYIFMWAAARWDYDRWARRWLKLK